MQEKIKWDFRALDLEDVGHIPVENALFLFKAVHGDRFSNKLWQDFLDDRVEADSDVLLEEVMMPLCNVPEFMGDKDEDFVSIEKSLNDLTKKRDYDEYRALQGWMVRILKVVDLIPINVVILIPAMILYRLDG